MSFKSMNIPFVSIIQYFVVQIGVTLNTRSDYHTLENNISDLGNSKIVGQTNSKIMNTSFVLAGIGTILGSILYFIQTKSLLVKIAMFLMFLSGIGSMIVGFFPENVNTRAHNFGAGLVFVFGNLSLLLIGLGNSNKAMVVFSVAALLLIPMYILFDIEYKGLIERLIAWPQSLFLIYIGFQN